VSFEWLRLPSRFPTSVSPMGSAFLFWRQTKSWTDYIKMNGGGIC